MLRIKLPDWRTEANLIQDVNELPEWYDNKYLYLDVETTSSEDKVTSINPWHNCKLLGIAAVVDDERNPVYIPLRHRGPNSLVNLPVEPVLKWLQRVLNGSKCWVNHNIKYDAHVCQNEGIDVSHPILLDTLSYCKLAPEEERFQYKLTSILQDWFYHDISSYEDNIQLYLKKGEKDYGLIPIDQMCSYAAVDALAVRHIHTGIKMPEECSRVVELETEVTQVLYDIEREGMSLDLETLGNHYCTYPAILAAIQRTIERLAEFPDFRPHTNADCKAYIVHQLGLPVIERTEKDAPSFGSNAILAYKAMRPDLKDIWDWVLKYKELHKLYTAFVVSYEEKRVGNRIHSDYNQIVRTGRMSCRTPNMQQLSKAAKVYIVPSSSDRVIVDIDFSQIEFRLIAHFTKAERIINEYNKNPNADYHSIMADLCRIARTPAKRVNFMLGYGGGRGKCIEILSSEPEIIEELDDRDAIEKRANAVYKRYHQMVPTLRPTTYNASAIMRQRGYVRTLLKRRRYLPRRAHFKAFNSVVQGSAADLFKNALVRLHRNLKPGTKLIGCVHDSFVLDMPKEDVITEVPRLTRIVEELPEGVTLRVPLRADAQWSAKSWQDSDCPVYW